MIISPDHDIEQPLSSWTIALIIVATFQFLGPFLVSSVNVALPAIGNELSASASQLGLVNNVMVLATVAFLLPVGRLSDIYGRKRIFFAGAAMIAIVTLALGITDTMWTFLVLRFFQGLANAMIMVSGFAILITIVPVQRRGRAIGIVVAMIYTGMSAGPSLSGFIISQLGWRWIFFLVFGIVLLALLMALIWLKGEWVVSKGEPFDYKGAGLFAVSLCLITYGVTQMAKEESAFLLMLLGIIGLGFFIFIEWNSSYPLLDLHLMINNLNFTFNNIYTFFNYASTTSFIFFFSLYLQYVKELSPQNAGLFLIIQPIAQAVFSLLAGRLADRYQPSGIATAGMAICTIALFSAALIDKGSSFPFIVVVSLLLGIGLGFFSTPNMTAVMSSVSAQYHGLAASMVSTMRNLGMLFCTTIITVVLFCFLGNQPVMSNNTNHFVRSMHFSFLLFGILSLAGTLLSILINRKIQKR